MGVWKEYWDVKPNLKRHTEEKLNQNFHLSFYDPKNPIYVFHAIVRSYDLSQSRCTKAKKIFLWHKQNLHKNKVSFCYFCWSWKDIWAIPLDRILGALSFKPQCILFLDKYFLMEPDLLDISASKTEDKMTMTRRVIILLRWRVADYFLMS